MDKEYFATRTLHHGVAAPNSLAPAVNLVIPGKQFFNPTAFGLGELEVAEMLARGQILTRAQHDEHEARMAEARVLTDRSNVVTRTQPVRSQSVDSMLLSNAELDRIIK